MTDFDPDAYLEQSSAAPAFDPDAYLTQPAAPASSEKKTYAPPASSPVGRNPKMGRIDAKSDATAGDLTQAAASGVNAGAMDLLGLPMDTAANVVDLGKAGIGTLYHAATGNDIPQALQIGDRALVPGTSEWLKAKARETAGANTVDISNSSGQDLSALHTAGEVAGPAPLAAGMGTIRGPANIAPRVSTAQAAQNVVDQATMNSPQSMGAAAAAPRMTQVSPELQQAVVQAAQKSGGAVNPEILNRHIEADSLPVKIQLTPGQAAQDPALISHEMNNRGKTPGLPDLLNEQNKKLTQNLQAIRDQVGPDVFSANPVEHGDTLIQAYKDKGAAADTETSAKYQALKDANGGQFPVDASALLKNATGELHKELLFDHAPKAVMSTLGRLADGGNMTFENFESLRTNLARIQRSPTADGNEKAAAGVIRSAMEELPLAPGAASLKPLADAARSAARTQFEAVKADPAYKAAINDEVSPDQFVQKFIIRAPRDAVALMKENLAHDPSATQTMGVGMLDHLRQAAGINADGKGTFSQAGYNKHLQAQSPKLSSVLDPKAVEQLETVGNVAHYTQVQPKGSFVNNSNTLVGAIASHAAGAAEGIANVKAGGFPIGTITRKVLQNRAAAKQAKETMTPYGGLTRLSDVAKGGQP